MTVITCEFYSAIQYNGFFAFFLLPIHTHTHTHTHTSEQVRHAATVQYSTHE